jgi:tRNA1Val (adenine37-N6)-methyltransferase
MIICNPPYRKTNSGRNCDNKVKNIAKFNEEMDLNDVCKFSNRYLKNLGYLYFSYDADLAIEAISICKKNNLEPKTLKLLHPDINKPAKLIFFECRKNGKTELKIEPPLFQRINGKESEEFNKLLNRE